MAEVTDDTLKALATARPAYKWKVQEAKQNGCTCVAYVDARQVMSLLDEVVGPANWQDHYREVAGNVYCDLSIRVGDSWVTKSDCGTESNFEAEKGQASDAFKRAAVKWGICRFLYELPIIRIKEVVEAGKDSKGKPRFAPAHNGQRIWDLTDHIRKHKLDRSGQQAADKPTQPAQTGDKSHLARPLPAATNQRDNIQELCGQLNMDGKALQEWLRGYGWTWKGLTQEQAVQAIDMLQGLVDADVPTDSPLGQQLSAEFEADRAAGKVPV